jgi:formyl-CoA transferase
LSISILPTLFVDNAHQMHRRALIELINDAFADRTVVELLAELDKAGIPAGEVRTLDRVYEWDQTQSQGLLLEVDHSTLGKINLPGPPLRFDAHSVTADHRPPPTLGQHNQTVRHWLDELEQPSTERGSSM